MKFLVVIGAVLCATLIKGAPSSLVQFPEDSIQNGRIVQGYPTTVNQFPHMVHLNMFLTPGSRVCAGTLISPRYILTAAHCMDRATSVVVSLGSNNVNGAQLIVTATRFTIHPLFNPNNFNNDLAIIDMQQNIPVSNAIRPIALPRLSQTNETFEDRVATVSGWGYITDGGPVTSLLRYANLTIISNERCIEEYSDEIVINSTVCAIGVQDPTQNACNGDSGGSLQLEDEDGQLIIVGIVNFVSIAGCSSGKPSGYVRPHYYWDFISEYTGIPIRE